MKYNLLTRFLSITAAVSVVFTTAPAQPASPMRWPSVTFLPSAKALLDPSGKRAPKPGREMARIVIANGRGLAYFDPMVTADRYLATQGLQWAEASRGISLFLVANHHSSVRPVWEYFADVLCDRKEQLGLVLIGQRSSSPIVSRLRFTQKFWRRPAEIIAAIAQKPVDGFDNDVRLGTKAYTAIDSPHELRTSGLRLGESVGFGRRLQVVKPSPIRVYPNGSREALTIEQFLGEHFSPDRKIEVVFPTSDLRTVQINTYVDAKLTTSSLEKF